MNTLLFILPFVVYSAGLASGQLYHFSAVTLETPEGPICLLDSGLEAVRMNISSNVSHSPENSCRDCARVWGLWVETSSFPEYDRLQPNLSRLMERV